MSITQSQLRVLRTEMQAALNKAGLTGFTAEVGNMRYGDTEVTIKVVATVSGVQPKKAAGLEEQVALLGLKLVSSDGKKLTGYTPSRWKFPFSYETVRGARYKCSEEQAKAIFG